MKKFLLLNGICLIVAILFSLCYIGIVRFHNKKLGKICKIMEEIITKCQNSDRQNFVFIFQVPKGSVLIYSNPYSSFADMPISCYAKRKLHRVAFDREEPFLALVSSFRISYYYLHLPFETSVQQPIFWQETDGYIIITDFHIKKSSFEEDEAEIPASVNADTFTRMKGVFHFAGCEKISSRQSGGSAEIVF